MIRKIIYAILSKYLKIVCAFRDTTDNEVEAGEPLGDSGGAVRVVGFSV